MRKNIFGSLNKLPKHLSKNVITGRPKLHWNFSHGSDIYRFPILL